MAKVQQDAEREADVQSNACNDNARGRSDSVFSLSGFARNVSDMVNKSDTSESTDEVGEVNVDTHAALYRSLTKRSEAHVDASRKDLEEGEDFNIVETLREYDPTQYAPALLRIDDFISSRTDNTLEFVFSLKKTFILTWVFFFFLLAAFWTYTYPEAGVGGAHALAYLPAIISYGAGTSYLLIRRRLYGKFLKDVGVAVYIATTGLATLSLTVGAAVLQDDERESSQGTRDANRQIRLGSSVTISFFCYVTFAVFSVWGFRPKENFLRKQREMTAVGTFTFVSKKTNSLALCHQ